MHVINSIQDLLNAYCKAHPEYKMEALQCADKAAYEIRTLKETPNQPLQILRTQISYDLIMAGNTTDAVCRILDQIHHSFQNNRTPIEKLEDFLRKTGYGK